VRTTIGGVSHLFCLGMVRPNGPSDPISGRDVKWDSEIKQRPMDDLGLCALGPILIPRSANKLLPPFFYSALFIGVTGTGKTFKLVELLNYMKNMIY
jgi:hypothetical protein